MLVIRLAARGCLARDVSARVHGEVRAGEIAALEWAFVADHGDAGVVQSPRLLICDLAAPQHDAAPPAQIQEHGEVPWPAHDAATIGSSPSASARISAT